MIAFGAELFQLSLRYLEGQMIEPFHKSSNGTIAAAAFTITHGLIAPPPQDRMLWIYRVCVVCDDSATPASRCSNAILDVAPRAHPAARVRIWSGNGQADAANPLRNEYQVSASAQFVLNLELDLMLPSSADLRFTGVRTDATNAATIFVAVHGYSIPIGNLSRWML